MSLSVCMYINPLKTEIATRKMGGKQLNSSRGR